MLMGLPMVVLSGLATRQTTLCHDDCEQLTKSHRDHMDTLIAQQVCMSVCVCTSYDSTETIQGIAKASIGSS